MDTKGSLVTRWYCVEKPSLQNSPIEMLVKRFQSYVPGIVMKVHNLNQTSDPGLQDYKLLKIEIPSPDGKITDQRRILVSEKYGPLDKKLEICEASLRYPSELDAKTIEETETILREQGWKRVEKKQ
jgi:hypothetical protein